MCIIQCKADFTLRKRGGILDNKIKKMRKERGITQDEFGKILGVTRQTIISLESGRYDASLKLAHRIAEYFGVKIEDVFVFDD